MDDATHKRTTRPGRRDVHLYCLVRLKVRDVDATSDEDAIEQAQERYDLDRLFQRGLPRHADDSDYTEFAEEIQYIMIDDADDREEYQYSRRYHQGEHAKWEED